MSPLLRGHANLLCIVPALVYVLPKRAPAPVFLPGKSHGQRSLAGYSPWGCKESDMTELAHPHTATHTPPHTATHTQDNRNLDV